jgi:hypothetical protein
MKSGKVIDISPPRRGTAQIEAFVKRLTNSNGELAAALVRMRDFYLAGSKHWLRIRC